MLPRLAAWCCRTPLRLALVSAIATAALVMGGTWLLNDTPDPTHEARSEAANTSATTEAPQSADSQSATTPDPDEAADTTTSDAKRAARRFLNVYLQDSKPVKPSEWQHAVRPVVTPALWRGLKHTDPTVLPRGRYQLQDQTTGSFGAVFDVDLTEGPDLRLSLVVFDGHWRVANVDQRP